MIRDFSYEKLTVRFLFDRFKEMDLDLPDFEGSIGYDDLLLTALAIVDPDG